LSKDTIAAEKMYGGMKVDQARKYEDLELENT
jgi:hypothetical protein